MWEIMSRCLSHNICPTLLYTSIYSVISFFQTHSWIPFRVHFVFILSLPRHPTSRPRTTIWPPRPVRHVGQSPATTSAPYRVLRWDIVASWQSHPWSDLVADHRDIDIAFVCPNNDARRGVYRPWYTDTWRGTRDIAAAVRDPDEVIGREFVATTLGPN